MRLLCGFQTKLLFTSLGDAHKQGWAVLPELCALLTAQYLLLHGEVCYPKPEI